MNAVAVGTLRCAVEAADKPRHFGPGLLPEPAGRPVAIAAFIQRSYYYTIDLAARYRLAADGEVQPDCGSLAQLLPISEEPESVIALAFWDGVDFLHTRIGDEV